MKKIILTSIFTTCGLLAFAQTTTEEAPSLDFTAGGITYTILDANEHTCQTKAGSAEMHEDEAKIYFTYGNTNTGAVTIPATVVNESEPDITYKVVAIGSYGFSQAESVEISEGISTISTSAFAGNTTLKAVTIPESVTNIGAYAFAGCTALNTLTLPSQLGFIANNTFASSGITTINIPESVTSIGDNAFSSCGNLQMITIPNSVTNIGNSSFYGCNRMTTLSLSENLSSIPANAFYACNSLTSLTIPANVNSIGENAFRCPNLTEITCLSMNVPAISYNSFSSNLYSAATLYVYNNVMPLYKKSTLWSGFSKIEVIPVETTSVSIVPGALTLNVGYSGQLAAVLTPAESSQSVTWSIESSTPDGVIEIDNNGKVLSKKIGSAVVKATSGTVSATCEVTVKANPNESVKINTIQNPIYVGDEITLTAVVTPSTITPSIMWASSNTAVATINETTGLLTAVAPGATIITATNDNVIGKLSVNILEVAAESVSLDKTAITLKAGDTETLTATVSPKNVTYPVVTWESSDPNVAIVSNGVVTAIGVGSATVRAMCGGYTANCTVTVEATPVESVELNLQTATLKIGQNLQLTATVTPDNATDKTVNWTSSDTSVATVDTNGVVTALQKGTATITASNGDVNATCTLTVEEISSEEIVLNYVSISLKVGESSQLIAQIFPEDTTDKNITWSSSDPSIATVDNGLVTALATGEVNITAANGTLTAQCSVNVQPVVVEQIVLDKTTDSVNVGETTIITATVYPENATDAVIEWTSMDETIAKVENGMISGIAPGSTVITASCGTITASCIITVNQPAKSITLNETQLNLQVGEIYDLIETVNPADATDMVVWTSSDSTVATVDENGIVYAVAIGTSTITATCGEVAATCIVNVSDDDSDNIDSFLDLEKDDSFTIYNLMGVKLMENVSIDKLHNLDSGVYIINGRKVVIK